MGAVVDGVGLPMGVVLDWESTGAGKTERSRGLTDLRPSLCRGISFVCEHKKGKNADQLY